MSSWSIWWGLWHPGYLSLLLRPPNWANIGMLFISHRSLYAIWWFYTKDSQSVQHRDCKVLLVVKWRHLTYQWQLQLIKFQMCWCLVHVTCSPSLKFTRFHLMFLVRYWWRFEQARTKMEEFFPNSLTILAHKLSRVFAILLIYMIFVDRFVRILIIEDAP